MSSVRAMVRTSMVLATPGTPSNRTWPLLRRAAKASSITPSWPMMTRSISARIWRYRAWIFMDDSFGGFDGERRRRPAQRRAAADLRRHRPEFSTVPPPDAARRRLEDRGGRERARGRRYFHGRLEASIGVAA